MEKRQRQMKEVRYAFMQSLPVMLGYLFLGVAFGLMLQNAGYDCWWAFFCSLFIYAGSMQFVLVTLLTGGASLVNAALMTLFINSRHMFYGLSFVEKFRQMGRMYPYMVFSLTDETYSVLCSLRVTENMSEKNISFMIALFDHIYWIVGSVVGAAAGQMITFDSTGIDFSMTALFVVIVINQWVGEREHKPALIGFAAAIVSLVLLGSDNFLLPALSAAVIILLLVKPVIQKETDGMNKNYAKKDLDTPSE